MGVKIREKRGKLYLDVYFNGRRVWEALGLTVPADSLQKKEVFKLAEVLRSKRETQLVSGEWGLLDPVSGKKSLYQYIQELGEKQEANHKLNKCLRYLEKYPGGLAIQLQQVTGVWFEGFQSFLLKDTGLSQTTAYNYAAAVRYALNRAVRDNILPRNPAASIRGISLPESDKVYLNPEEIQRIAGVKIRGTLWPEIRRAFLFSCCTGLRVSDLRTITWGEIERDPLQIKKRQHKTGRIVYIPLNPTAWELINDNALHRHDEYIFPVLAGTLTNTNQYLKRAAEMAGVEKSIGWHTARHTFATLTLENGADFFTVSKLLGHTKTSTTAVYTKATDKLRRDAVNGLPGIDLSGAGGEG
jgi:integrase